VWTPTQGFASTGLTEAVFECQGVGAARLQASVTVNTASGPCTQVVHADVRCVAEALGDGGPPASGTVRDSGTATAADCDERGPDECFALGPLNAKCQNEVAAAAGCAPDDIGCNGARFLDLSRPVGRTSQCIEFARGCCPNP
jgi:hypothetical protein